MARLAVAGLLSPARFIEYRVVYRNEPDDAVVEVVAVIAVGLRERLAIYKETAARLREEMRRRLTE